MQWTARMGAVTAEALAIRQDTTLASARGRLQAAERAGLLTRQRPLAEQPALYTADASGPARVRPARAGSVPRERRQRRAPDRVRRVAAALERCYPDHRVLGERELRRDERELGVPLASARLGVGPHGGPLLHRPDLVALARGPDADGLPVAVEVELTVKAPRRLTDICRAWARCRASPGCCISPRRRSSVRWSARSLGPRPASGSWSSGSMRCPTGRRRRSTGAERSGREYRPKRCVASSLGVNHQANGD